MKTRNILVMFLGLFLVVLSASSDEIHATIHRPDGEQYAVSGEFSVQAPEAAVWQVLTDYDRIHLFVDNMKQSKVVRNEGEHFYVQQEFTGRYLFFKKNFTVLLRIREVPPAEIAFEDVSMRSFSVYRGSWTLHNE